MRGLRASTSRSAQRLKAMALVRAQTMQASIPASRHTPKSAWGTASARTTALPAKGKAKTVWAKATSEP